VKITKETAKILGLTKQEELILTVLNKEALTIPDLAFKTKIPRTSLYYMLPKLIERNFIAKRYINKKIYWKINSDETIKETYQKIAEQISESDKQDVIKNISNNANIKIYIGAKNVAKIFDDISKTNKNSRWYGIQPGPSILDLIPKVPVDVIIKFNRKVKEKRHIVEGIVHENYIDAMKKIMEPADFKNVLQSFWGRSSDYAKLPDDYMNNISSEIYLFENILVIANWKEEFAVVIHNEDVFQLLLEMFKSTKYMLNKYDQNEKIARKLVDLG
jgi:predicted transcriptional regulator